MTTRDLPTIPAEPGMLLDGGLVPAHDGARYPVLDPATGERLAMLPHASEGDVEAAVTVARRAFDVTAWSSDLDQRLHCLRQLHDALADEGEDLRSLTVRTAGVPVALTRGAWLDGAVTDLGLAVERAAAGDVPILPGGPGVVGVVTPWTSPWQVVLDRLGRALLAGGTVVLKPGAETALLACEVARLAAERTDLPPGVLNVVTTRDVDAAIALTTDPRVDLVSFTGSTVAAERVRHQVHPGEDGEQRHLEVAAGGTRAAIVLDGADLGAAVAATAREVATYAGQRCGVPARLLVPRDRYDEAVDHAVTAVDALQPGDPWDEATVCGPVVSPVQRDRVRRYLALAVQEGGRLAAGAEHPARERGWWVAPAVVAGLDSRDRVAREEVLGPVLVVLPHDGEEDALATAADSPYDFEPVVHRD